jgi:hypothetical protein
MVPGGSRRLQNDCEAHCVLGGFDSHALPPARTPCRQPVSVSALSSPLATGSRIGAILVAAALGVLAQPARAQVVDSARVAARQPTVDTTTKPIPAPPLSPRRAFLYSLLLPGYSQSVLGRPTAGALFVLTESIAIAMLRESKADLNEARRLRTDSVVVIGVDANGQPITHQSFYSDGLVNIRRGHVEDWVAFLIANHLFAGADAYVAAHLWDLPTQVSVRPAPSGAVVAARFTW